MSCGLPTISIPATNDPSNITFPGGASLTFFNNFETGSTPLSEIQSAVAPLAPLMNTVSSVTSIFDLLQTLITDPLAAPAKVAETGEKVGKLAAIAPQISLPATIVGIIDAIVGFLQKAITQLENLVLQNQRAEEVAARAAELGDACLSQIADNSKAAISTETDNVSTTLGASNGLIGILNLLMSIIGLGPVGDLSSMSGLAISLVVAPLAAFIGILLAVRSIIPV